MAPIVLLRLFRADCDFNLAALHPAYPIKRRTSAQRTQAPESVDARRASRLDPLENNIRRQQTSILRRFETSLKHLKCANSGRSPTEKRRGNIDPSAPSRSVPIRPQSAKERPFQSSSTSGYRSVSAGSWTRMR